MWEVLVSKYSSLFKKYNCFLNVSLFWNDFFTGYSSKSRLPFRNGYSCYMCCEVQREGKTVYVKSIDGEVDYYSVEAIWPVSAIERKLLKTEVVFYSNPEDVRNDMEQLSCTRYRKDRSSGNSTCGKTRRNRCMR